MTAMINSIPAILCTFVLNDDPHLNRVYECLKNTALGVYCCRSAGLSNLMPLFIISAINGTAIALELIPAFHQFGALAFHYIMFDVLILIGIIEIVMAVLAWKVL